MEEKNKKRTRTLFVILGILLAGTIAFTVLKVIPKYKNVSDKAVEAIPLDAAFIVKSNNFKDLLSEIQKNSFWNEIQGFELCQELNTTLNALDSVAFKNKSVNDIFNSETYVSFHLLGINKIKSIFFLTLKNHSANHLKNQIINLLGDKASITDRKYENYTIYDVDLKRQQKKFSFTFYQGILCISPSSILIENAVRQINSGYSFLNDPGFRKVKSTTGNSSIANIFINYRKIFDIVSIGFNNAQSSQIKSIKNIADWSELDLTLKNKLLLINGFTFSNDSNNNILNILKGQLPRKFTLHDVFPSTSSSFYVMLLSDPKIFNTNYRDYLLKEGLLNQYLSLLNRYEQKYGTDFEKLFYEIFENEMGEVYCNINNGDNSSERFFIINTKGQNLTEEKLINAIKKWAVKENKNLRDYTTTYSIDEGASQTIYNFPVSSIIKDIFGVFYNFNEAEYFAFIGNYLVFSGDKNSLSKLIYMNVLNKTLFNSLEYNDFNEYVNSRSNIYYYFKFAKSKGIIQKNLNNNIRTIYDNNHESFQKINTLAYQVSGTDDMLYNNITINYVNQTYDNPMTEWETFLDSSINFKPVLVINHYTKENEIFVQDLKNNIYLINNSGRIIWKHKLNEQINSDVYQVDYYKNGKLQLLFSTKNTIHLIDRNGNYVERYPIKLRSEATAGIALFDYDNNKTYRIFIPCKDKKVYAYSLDGKLVTGWKFTGTDHYVENPIQHFRVNAKDYIVFADKYKVYIQDRKGNRRVNPNEQFSKSANNIFYIDQGGASDRIVTTDKNGTVYYIHLNGNVDKVKTETFSENHFFEFQDVDADGQKDYIYIDKNELLVLNRNNKKILSLPFKDNIVTKPIYFNFSSKDKKIGIVDSKHEQIYLINNNGKLYKGFPLIGKSLFTIGKLENNYGNFNLIVGGRNNYLYNYAIN